MKIYFAGSIRGGRSDQSLYLDLIRKIAQYGKVLTEHIGDGSLSKMGEPRHGDGYIYERDMGWLEKADVVIAEVTTPSLGVGYEIARAELFGKPVLCLYRPQPGRKLSAMLSGNPNIEVKEYTHAERAEALIAEFLSSLS